MKTKFEDPTNWNAAYDHDFKQEKIKLGPAPFITHAIKWFEQCSGIVYADFACGNGNNTLHLSQHLPFVIGGDSSISAIRNADLLLRNNNVTNCMLVKIDILRLGLFEGQFDGLFCWDTLGHIEEVNLALNELLMTLKPNRYLVGSFYSTEDSMIDHEMHRIGNNEFVYDDKFYYQFFTKKDALGALGKTEAKIVQFEKIRWTEPPHPGFREYEHEHVSWVFVIRK